MHVLRRHEISIIALDGLTARDISDRSNGCVARLSATLGDRIGGGEDICALLIEEQVVVPEVGSGDVAAAKRFMLISKTYPWAARPRSAGREVASAASHRSARF